MPRYFDDGDPDRWERDEGNKVLRAILARSWYLVVPLIALWWFHSRVVVPQVQAVDEKIREDKQTAELTRNKILKEARDYGVETSRLRAEADTFNVRANQMATLLDSVRTIQNGHIEETRRLEAQSDSLRRILSTAEGRALEQSAELSLLQVKVDSLRTLIDGHLAESERLEQEIKLNEDLADRLRRPDAFRSNAALVTGEGKFPNRDALPKR